MDIVTLNGRDEKFVVCTNDTNKLTYRLQSNVSDPKILLPIQQLPFEALQS